MKTYNVITAVNRDLAITHNGIETGRLEYAKWYSNKPEFKSADGSVYTIKYKSFWKGTQEVLKNGSPWLLLKKSYKGYTVMPHKQEYHFYKIARRGAFKDGLIVENYKGEKLAELTVHFILKKFRTDYTITAIQDYGTTEIEQFLLVFMMHYYREEKRAAAAAG